MIRDLWPWVLRINESGDDGGAPPMGQPDPQAPSVDEPGGSFVPPPPPAAAPAPAQAPAAGPYGGYAPAFRPLAPYAPPGSAPAPAPSDPSDAGYDAIPQAYRNILEELEHSWQLAGGYASPVSKQNLVDMAKQHVVTLTDFGRYMWSNGSVSDATKTQMPWLGVGLTQGEYQKATAGLSSEWLKLTGQKVDLTGIGTTQDPNDPRSRMWSALASGQNVADFSESLMHDKAMTDTYKWLSHGIDYDQFQIKKMDMSREFGGNLTDDQAVLQLTYLQRNSTFEENQAVHAGVQTGEPQQALAQGAVGTSGSTSR